MRNRKTANFIMTLAIFVIMVAGIGLPFHSQKAATFLVSTWGRPGGKL